jgi:LPS-assembly protein
MYRVVIAVLLMCFLACPVYAATLDVEADTIKKTGQRIEASGNVVIMGKDITLSANYVVYDTLSEDLWASGNCQLREEQGEIDAETMYYNARRKDVQLENGSVFIYSEPMIISGKSISRYGQDVYAGENIEFTPCLGARPDWSMAASSLEVPLEGYGKARHARFMIRHVPVLYAPYLLYPAKLKRQSGLLFPEFSQSSDYGYRIGIPLYITLGRSSDMTLTPMHLSKRGLLTAAEFRYRLDYEKSGQIYVESLFDKDGGEPLDGGVLDRIPDHRWFIKANQTGGPLTWDINLVSHEDYFRDIGSFYGSEQYWKETSIVEDEKNLEDLISRMQWLSFGNGFSVSISGQWKQDLTVKGDDKTFQELPKIKARMNQRDIGHTPLKYSSEISTVRVYSEDWIEAIKDHAQLEVSWPLSVYPYFTLRPYVKEIYRDTYITDRRDVYENDSYQEHWQERGVSLTTTLYSSRFAGGWYHQMAPGMSWTSKSRIGGNYDAADPADIYPYILSGDDWIKTFDMKLSLDNYIRDESGKSILDFNISRIYSYITEDWDNFQTKVRLQPVSWFMAKHTNAFGREPFRPYATYEHSSEVRLSDDRGDSLYFLEEFNRLDTKSVVAGTRIYLGRGFSARLETEYDYIKRRYDSSRQGISYKSQCWSVDLYRDVQPSDIESPRETTIYLTVNFLGLGDVFNVSQSREGD